jgi:hypothetical protein
MIRGMRWGEDMIKGLFALFAVGFCVFMTVAIENCLISCRVKSPIGSAEPDRRLFASLYPLEMTGIPKPANVVYKSGKTSGGAVENGRYFEYAGCIHIHTTYSDGGGTYAEIAAAADSLGLDFIIPTDHNMFAPFADGWAKKVGGVLIIPAVENSTKHGAGHFLTIGDSLTLVRSAHAPSDSVYHDAERRGNMIFLAHVYHPAYNS